MAENEGFELNVISVVMYSFKYTPTKSYHQYYHLINNRLWHTEFNLNSSELKLTLAILVLRHAHNTITTGRYGSGEWDLEQLADTINKLPRIGKHD